MIETTLEQNLIEQLSQGVSQWTYRPDLKNEKDLWNNFRKLLEIHNQDKLDGKPLSDAEFNRIKNSVTSTSFYDAGEKLTGENGAYYVQINRDGRDITLLVFDRAQKTGGNTVYEIINQYNSFSTKEDVQDRRYDLTFLFNGIPMIHMELKNARYASYLDAFRQIQKYIDEGHFKGIFSLVQMFIVSNGVQTKYIAANEHLNSEFLTSWTEEDDPDKSVADVKDFVSRVLKIPTAHEMITDYRQLDAKNRRLIIMRPYQIQAIQAMRQAYMQQKDGYIWHATGSGKTITSYKAARNLLMDIPGLDKTIFLIDRKDLDDKTCDDFHAYAENDTIDVSGTDDVTELKKQLLSDKREMIITTVQKLQHLVREFNGEGRVKNPDQKKKAKIRSKHIAFVVDECHRTVTKATQVKLKGFFPHNMWYGFTGTPIFQENQGTLGSTTEGMYGKPLHCYTIKNALHDKSVLGFQVERLGPDNLKTDESGMNIDEDFSYYDKESHMLEVIRNIVNKSRAKLGIDNPYGQSYESILTARNIDRAQKYYDLIQAVKRGEKPVEIDKDILMKYPDFPKVAVTYSVTENKESSEDQKANLLRAIDDYNKMFDTKFGPDEIDAYNADVTQRLARGESIYHQRKQQLDMVIVAERLLTGFNAPCLSTIFIDRPPMTSHKIIQAFSRTNRIFDKNKSCGYVVTFQSPDSFKVKIDEAIQLFSNGGAGEVIAPSFEEVDQSLREAINQLRVIAPIPADCADFGTDDIKKKMFCLAFQHLDSMLFKIRTYIEWNDKNLERDYALSEAEHAAYAGWYRNFMDERRSNPGDPGDGPEGTDDPDNDYELMSYGRENIDYLYVVNLMKDFISTGKTAIEDIEKNIDLITKSYPALGAELTTLWENVRSYPDNYLDKDLQDVFKEMTDKTVSNALDEFCAEYCVERGPVEYSASCFTYKQEEIPSFDLIKEHSYLEEYAAKTNISGMNKLRYYKILRSALRKLYEEYVLPFKEIR